jgi:hypothetical protein
MTTETTPEMTAQDPVVRDFMRAGGALLEAAARSIHAADPAAAAGLASYVRTGGTMTATLSLAPGLGVGELLVGVVDQTGATRVLRSLNIRRQADA